MGALRASGAVDRMGMEEWIRLRRSRSLVAGPKPRGHPALAYPRHPMRAKLADASIMKEADGECPPASVKFSSPARGTTRRRGCRTTLMRSRLRASGFGAPRDPGAFTCNAHQNQSPSAHQNQSPTGPRSGSPAWVGVPPDKVRVTAEPRFWVFSEEPVAERSKNAQDPDRELLLPGRFPSTPRSAS